MVSGRIHLKSNSPSMSMSLIVLGLKYIIHLKWFHKYFCYFSIALKSHLLCILYKKEMDLRLSLLMIVIGRFEMDM